MAATNVTVTPRLESSVTAVVESAALELRMRRPLPGSTTVLDRVMGAPHLLEAAADALAWATAAATAGASVRPATAAILGATLLAVRPRRSRLRPAVLNGLPRLFGTVTAATAIAVAAGGPARATWSCGASLLVLAVAFRSTAAWGVGAAWRRGRGVRPTVLIGAEPAAARLRTKIEQNPDIGLRVVATIAPDGGATVAGAIAATAAREIIAIPGASDMEAVANCLEACDGTGAHAWMVPPLGEFMLDPREVEHVAGIRLIRLGHLSRSPRHMAAKRALDILGAGLGLIVLSPVLALVALLVKLDSRGPVLFRQTRVGRHGRTFSMFKVRSMVDGAEQLRLDLTASNEANGLLFKIRDDPRVTRVGRIIRLLSIDELPQLLNVLRGEMSLVGPRPLPVDDCDYGAIDGKRLNVRPGITGFWQIVGRSDLGYDEMVKLDLAYIQRCSVWTDLYILLRTVPVVVRGRGAY